MYNFRFVQSVFWLKFIRKNPNLTFFIEKNPLATLRMKEVNNRFICSRLIYLLLSVFHELS